MARSVGLRNRIRRKALRDKVKRNTEAKILKKLSIWILTPRMRAEEQMKNKREVRCSNQ